MINLPFPIQFIPCSTYEVHNRLSFPENLVFSINLGDCKLRAGKWVRRLASRSLNAALLFNPWTLASRAKESLPCLLFHRVEDEDGRAEVRGTLSLIALFTAPRRTQSICKQEFTLRYLKKAFAACCESMGELAK